MMMYHFWELIMTFFSKSRPFNVGFPIFSDVSLQKAQPLQSLDSIFRLDYVNIWIMSAHLNYECIYAL